MNIKEDYELIKTVIKGVLLELMEIRKGLEALENRLINKKEID